MIDLYKLYIQNNCIVVTYPSYEKHELYDFKHNEILFNVNNEYQQWSNAMEVVNVGQVNKIVRTPQFRSYLQICEAMYNQKLADISTLIVNGIRRQPDSSSMLCSQIEIEKLNVKKKNSILIGGNELNDQIKLVLLTGPSSSGKTTTAMKL